MSNPKFEDALKRLEKIVGELEDGSLTLDDSLTRYEEGIKLSKQCAEKLEQARKKVEVLLKDDKGKIKLEPFEEVALKSTTKKSKTSKNKTAQTKEDDEFLF